MVQYGFVSLLPILVAIVVAVATRKVILALFLGVLVGTVTLAGGHPIAALTALIRDYLVVQLADPYNAGVLVLLAFLAAGAHPTPAILGLALVALVLIVVGLSSRHVESST